MMTSEDRDWVCIQNAMNRINTSDQDQAIVRIIYEHRSFTEAFSAFDLTKGRIKHRFFKTCNELEKELTAQDPTLIERFLKGLPE